MQLVSRTKSFGGWLETYSHPSVSTQSPMRFAIYLPPQTQTGKCPVVYWLSGLTCTEENFMMKAGAQRYASELGLVLVAPDTSPRNTGIEGEAADSNLGAGAGFYVNATQMPWAKHFKMEDYITKDLIAAVEAKFPVIPGCRSVSGHSMGGHGALMLSLRHPALYKSVSAFAPIVAPAQSFWGEKALATYLGPDRQKWEEYDTSCLVLKATQKKLLFIDQGADDPFYQERLKLPLLLEACKKVGYPIEARVQPGYDHSYYFVASFIGEHLKYHAKALGV